MVGIKDIAKKAGVAISTVSYALNGSDQVSEKTRQRILAIADELHYIPNRAGQNLRGKSSKIIGVYLTNYHGSFYSDVLEGMLEQAKEESYDLITCSGNRSRLFLPQALIDGALILDAYFPSEEIINYANRGKSIVVMDRKIENSNIRQVLLDNRSGSAEATQMICRQGCKKVYLISGPKENFDSTERLSAAEEILKIANVTYEIIPGDFKEPSGLLAAEHIHQEQNDFPIGIFALNDEMALGVYNYFKETEYKIGKDIFLVGFDGIKIGQYTQPTLASITFSERDWGKIAIKTLIAMIEGKNPKNSEIPTIIQAGASLPESLK